MAASDPTMAVATPTGVLQGVAAFSWDSTAWQPVGRAGPAVATPTGALQGVAPFAWDGSVWQPSGRAGPGVATPTGVLDGVAVYTWSGSAWVPAGGQPTPSTPSGALRGVAAFNWDGSAWQPAAQAGPSVATPYGALDGVAMFNWTGTVWAAASAGPPGVTLDLSFMTPGTLDPRITFTRASTATYFDSAGTLQTATTNTPRWDYDPVTHVLRGLLIEEARTNLLLNSATLVTQSVTTTAVSTTLSFYGTGTVTLSGTSTAGPLTGTGAANRVSLTFTPTAGTLTCTVTGSVVNAQLEVGAFSTSYIPTTIASAVRSAESCMLVNAGIFGGTTARTISVDGLAVQNTAAGTNTAWARLDDGTAANFMMMLTPAASPVIRYGVTVGSVSIFSQGDITTGVRPTLFKSALANGTTTANAAMNGVANAGGALPATLVLGPLTTLSLGASISTTTQINGYIRRVRYWPRALTNAELQSVTT